LKPENVLIDLDGYTKLCDFGLSVMLPKKDADSDPNFFDERTSSQSSERSGRRSV
jgi:serine/threonine protein kinase